MLAYLLRHRERVVPKTELFDQIWGNRFVSESALSSRIKSARRAVGDTGRDQRIIKTIYGRGYRFVADVNDQLARRRPGRCRHLRHQRTRCYGPSAMSPRAPERRSGSAAVPGPGRPGCSTRRQRPPGSRRWPSGCPHRPRPAPVRTCASPRFSTRWPVPPPDCLMRSRPDAGPNSSEPSPGDCPRHVSAGSSRCASSSSSRRTVGRGAPARRSPSRSSRSLAPGRGLARLTRGHRLAVIIAERPDARRWPGFEVAKLAEGHRPQVDRDATVDLPAGVARLIDLDAAAARVADLLLAAGEPAMAAPFALEAARIAAASGLYAEVLSWTEAVRDHVDGEAAARAAVATGGCAGGGR